MRASAWITALAALAFAAPAAAGGEVNEIIVTAQKYSDEYDVLIVPHVTTTRRADFAIVDLEVSSDTRDESQRTNEMVQALKGLESRAKAGVVTLALADEGNGIVRDFSLAAASELMHRGRLADTSTLTVQLRTPVSPADTLDTVHERIERFVDNAPKPGRIEMFTGDTALTLINPEQYRAPLLEAVIADWRAIGAMIGEGYGARVGGLERQVAWRRSGDLELTLFVPYSLTVAPVGAP